MIVGPTIWIAKVSKFPGSPLSSAMTTNCTGPRLLSPVPVITLRQPGTKFEIDVLSTRKPPTTSYDGASTASVHPANARDLVRKSPDILRRKILDTLLRVNREPGLYQGGSLAAGRPGREVAARPTGRAAGAPGCCRLPGAVALPGIPSR